MNNYQKIEAELKEYSGLNTDNLTEDKLKDLKYKFRSEQTEVWVAAAKSIGKLAAQGNQELKDFLQEKLIQHDNIHRLRHALTALGSYYGYSENPNEEFEFLKQYKQPQAKTEKMKLEDFIVTEIFDYYRKDIILGEVIHYIENWEESQGDDWPKNKDTFKLFKEKLLVLDDLSSKKNVIRSKYRKEIADFSGLTEIKTYQELLEFLAQNLCENEEIEVLKDLEDGFIDSLFRLEKKEKLLKLSLAEFSITKLLEAFSLQGLKKQEQKIAAPVQDKFGNQWYIGSLVYSLEQIYFKQEKLNLVIRKLIKLGSENIEYINNLSYFFLKEIKQSGVAKVIDEFKAELLLFKKHFKKNRLKLERGHFSDFYFDFEFLFEKLSQADNNFSLKENNLPLVELVDAELVEQYKKIKQSKNKNLALELLNQIRDEFCPRREWKKLDHKVKNRTIIFDLIIKDERIWLDYTEKKNIILEEIEKWKQENEALLALLVRELKVLYFVELEKAKGKKELFKLSKEQIYSIDDLLGQLNWEENESARTVPKDFASIIINVFDTLWGKEEKGELLLFELIFTVFSYIPADKIIDEMLYYSKNRELEEMFEGYRSCIKESGKEFACKINGFIDILKKYNISKNTIKVMEELLKQNLIEDNQSFIRSKAFENAILKEELQEQRDAVQNLLDNTGQGILRFGFDLIIEDEYSAKCTEIFSGKIAGQKFINLISDKEQSRLLERRLKSILEADETQREVFQELFIAEIEDLKINNKIIDFNYKIIQVGEVEKIMVILTDITKQRKAEKKAEQERRISEMISQVAQNSNEFIRLKNRYYSFCQEELPQILELEDKSKILEQVFNSIHTFKGSFDRFKMLTLGEKLHFFEDEIKNLKVNLINLDIKNYFIKFDLLSYLEQDLKILKEKLGKIFFSKEDIISVKTNELIKIEEKIDKSFISEKEEISSSIRALRYQSLKDKLFDYQWRIDKLQKKYNKTNVEFKVKGTDILLNPEIYNDFIDSLIHIFSNMITHGIENNGSIECYLEDKGKYFILKIADDGRGIDLNKIKEKAITEKLYQAEIIEGFSKDRLLDILFENEFSTAEKVTKESGRGVGLSAVKAEVEKLDGKVKINSQLDDGTEFEFLLPYYK